ncbi:MAG: isoprenylcysteine carboxylmethyltransferase family protein [Aestuariivirga sp.]
MATTDSEPQKRKHVIDPSAWISGISYFIGCIVAGGSNILGEILNNKGAMILLPLSYAAFIASVMLIQRHMKKSLLASTFGKPQTLVTSGIFAWSRHPIYAAFLMPLIALASLSYPAAAIGIITYVILMEIFVIRPEEAELAEIFGQDFLNWKSVTRRWI